MSGYQLWVSKLAFGEVLRHSGDFVVKLCCVTMLTWTVILSILNCVGDLTWIGYWISHSLVKTWGMWLQSHGGVSSHPDCSWWRWITLDDLVATAHLGREQSSSYHRAIAHVSCESAVWLSHKISRSGTITDRRQFVVSQSESRTHCLSSAWTTGGEPASCR